jgi:hypothetical protein
MQLLGKCVLCRRDFGVVPNNSLRLSKEVRRKASEDSVSMWVSLRVCLLVIGGQITRFKNSEVLDLIKKSCGSSVREFLGSRICPDCFPADQQDDEDVSDEDEEYDEDSTDEDEESDDDFLEYDEDGEPIQQPVRALQVKADGSSSAVTVKDFDDLTEHLGLQDGDVDHSYLRELGVFIYFDGWAAQRLSPLNSYLAVLGGGPVRGDVIIVSDIDQNETRSPVWQDLPEDWLDGRLSRVIEIVNTDPHVRKDIAEILGIEN